MKLSVAQREAIASALARAPNPARTFAYGTAGFRAEAESLEGVFVRVGLLSWLRAVKVAQVIGLMTTASHNPPSDNGVKIVDPDGGMLAPQWEIHAAKLCNAPAEAVPGAIEDICAVENVKLQSSNEGIFIFMGRDTRAHSEKLSDLAAAGVKALGGSIRDLGVVTTPILHHCVRSFNNETERDKFASVDGYYAKLKEAFQGILQKFATSENGYTDDKPPIVDAAYGVGGPCIAQLCAMLNLSVDVRNIPLSPEDSSKLNDEVGAEHVQKKLLFPKGTLHLPEERMRSCCSFDGDADRIVFYRADENDALNLFDGDKIASLFTLFIQQQLSALPEALAKGLKMGCVQTAYANGASTKYINEVLKVETPRTKTGVKFLHHKALEYDIGVYFEANGHGTVLFKEAFIQRLREGSSLCETADAQRARDAIFLLEQLINQATGDAISDFLAVEAVLRALKLSLDDWANLYRDLPSRQLKCKVKDRSAIKTSPDETSVLEPAELQKRIDTAVSTYTSGRAFARPSGTEDAVRVYAEAASQKEADALATEILRAIHECAGGVGDRP